MASRTVKYTSVVLDYHNGLVLSLQNIRGFTESKKRNFGPENRKHPIEKFSIQQDQRHLPRKQQ